VFDYVIEARGLKSCILKMSVRTHRLLAGPDPLDAFSQPVFERRRHSYDHLVRSLFVPSAYIAARSERHPLPSVFVSDQHSGVFAGTGRA
jgi:hypothetical protein